jgi:hypothetical protein
VNISDDEDGEPRRRERLRSDLRFAEACRFVVTSISILSASSIGDCDPLGDGTSFRNAINTDSSIRL